MNDFSPRSYLSLIYGLLLPLLLPLPALADSQPPAVTPAAILPRLVARQDTSGTTSCVAFDNLLNSCSAQTPSFLSLAFQYQASCLCSSGGSYAPDPYDSAWGNCVAYYKTADPAFYSSLAPNGVVDTQPCKDL